MGGIENAASMAEVEGMDVFLNHGANIVLLKQAFDRIQADFAPLGFTFDGELGYRPVAAASNRADQRQPAPAAP